MANSISMPRRSTISIFGDSQPQVKTISTKPGQCTHLTMTRLYTTDFQCQVCFRYGSFGWIYRCTQDRETLIENDIDMGREEKLDTLCSIFPESNDPKKRSAAARADRFGLLREMSDKHFVTYTPEQIGKLLEQRGHLLDVLMESDPGYHKADKTFPNPFTSNSPKPQTKPWLPQKECQFKCCHTCRPTLGERSYLSLNGILNGDIPATATVGFGFHLEKRRPVGKFEHVKNLGLRPSPPRTQSPTEPRTDLRHRKLLLRKPNFGLGILAINPDSEINRPVPPTPFSFVNALATSSGLNIETGLLTQYSSQEMALISQLQSQSTTPIRRPLPIPPSRLPPTSSPTAAHKSEEVSITTLASQTVLPEQTNKEIDLMEIPLTPMEESEKHKGVFGEMPLNIRDEVAVTEEAVGLHVADVTQF